MGGERIVAAEGTGSSPVALVTGGGTGLGLEISRQLKDLGYRLAITYSKSEAEANEGAESLRATGAVVSVHKVDVKVGAEVDALIDAVYEKHDQLDLVVNNASATRWIAYPDLAAADEAAWDEVMDVNLKGTYLVSRAAALRMTAAAGGAILNISSTAGIAVGGSSIPYAVAKSGIVHLTKMLAVALAPKIRVNCVAPSFMPTRWWLAEHKEAFDRNVKNSRFGRAVAVEDTARAAVMLATNESISGQTLVVDLAGSFH
jgi:3-oxoacyl-[acyl-carrier protein] reductase